MSHAALLRDIRVGLRASSDPASLERLRRLVSGAHVLGVSVPVIRRQVAEFAKEHRDLDVTAAADLFDDLSEERIREEILFGTFLLARFQKGLPSLGWNRIERWLEKIDNWETCDQLATCVAAPMGAGIVNKLLTLTSSRNPWHRRFALAVTTGLNQRGRSHVPETLRICEPLLQEDHVDVYKAVGWALREASKLEPKAVYDFLRIHKDHASPRVVREGSEKLAASARERLLRGR